jgi:hypothetical protein
MSSRILSWKHVASKCAPFGRTPIMRNPSGDQNIVTICFGLLIIFLEIVGGEISARVYIYLWLMVKSNHDSSPVKKYRHPRCFANFSVRFRSIEHSNRLFFWTGESVWGTNRTCLTIQPMECRWDHAVSRGRLIAKANERTEWMKWRNLKFFGDSVINSVIGWMTASRCAHRDVFPDRGF